LMVIIQQKEDFRVNTVFNNTEQLFLTYEL
jgi:hypothetical protein